MHTFRVKLSSKASAIGPASKGRCTYHIEGLRFTLFIFILYISIIYFIYFFVLFVLFILFIIFIFVMTSDVPL